MLGEPALPRLFCLGVVGDSCLALEGPPPGPPHSAQLAAVADVPEAGPCRVSLETWGVLCHGRPV